MSGVHYYCKTCLQPFGFGRMSKEPAECGRCAPSPISYVAEPDPYLEGVADEQDRIIKLIEEHQLTGHTYSGFLVECSCGTAVDDFREHLALLIKGENK